MTAHCASAISRSAMTATPPCIISTARWRPARSSPSSDRTAPASRRCSRASSARSSRSPAASSATVPSPATLPICRKSPRSTARFRSMSTTWWRWGCGGAKACSAASAARTRRPSKPAIAAVGLTGFEQRSIGTLSGGQMQRMLFARLLVQDARMIVLDEPFSAIDSKTVRRPDASGAALARRTPHRAGRHCTTSNWCSANFPRSSAARPRAGGVGRDARGADAGKSRSRRAACARHSTTPPRHAPRGRVN